LLSQSARLRRWALGAQLGLVLSLLALALLDNPAEQMGLLMLLGVLINSFAATQDVAIDGMAIDVTPANEQGRLNAFMGFGKAFGWASTSAASGVLLVTWGIEATAIAAASGAAIVLFAFIFVLENEGERLLPWTTGKASSAHHEHVADHKVFARINKILWLRASVVVMIIVFFDGLVSGYGQALMPVAAVNLFGFTTPQWSQLVAVMGMVGAMTALVLGPMIDRVGARRQAHVNAKHHPGGEPCIPDCRNPTSLAGQHLYAGDVVDLDSPDSGHHGLCFCAGDDDLLEGYRRHAVCNLYVDHESWCVSRLQSFWAGR
jgi:PAT family beta-lactamase induction signal transducer AmpG